MAAQAAVIAETIIGMKRALVNENESMSCVYSIHFLFLTAQSF